MTPGSPPDAFGAAPSARAPAAANSSGQGTASARAGTGTPAAAGAATNQGVSGYLPAFSPIHAVHQQFPAPYAHPSPHSFFLSGMHGAAAQHMAAAARAAASQAAASHAIVSPVKRGGGRGRHGTPTGGNGGDGRAGRKVCRQCNCKNSRCLKLYCECFASGRYCDGCNCVNCCNNSENEAIRQAAIVTILERNPNAFRPKIAGDISEEGAALGGPRHNKGCNCKKSGCLKKYCECFQAGIACSENCKCLDCKNYPGSVYRNSLVPHTHGAAADAGSSGTAAAPVRSPLVPRLPTMTYPPAPIPTTGVLPSTYGAPPPAPTGAGLASPADYPALGAAPPAMADADTAGPSTVRAPGSAGPSPAVLPGPIYAQTPGLITPAPPLPISVSTSQRAGAMQEAFRMTVTPEVVHKVGMLLLVLPQERQDAWNAAGKKPESTGIPGSPAIPSPGGNDEETTPRDAIKAPQGNGTAAVIAGIPEQASTDASTMEVKFSAPLDRVPDPEVVPGHSEATPVTAAQAGEASAASAPPADAPAGPLATPGPDDALAAELYADQERVVLWEIASSIDMVTKSITDKMDRWTRATNEQAAAFSAFGRGATTAPPGSAQQHLLSMQSAAHAAAAARAGFTIPSIQQLPVRPPPAPP